MPEEKNSYPAYDDATLEKMKRYYRLADNEELLKYIKTHGMPRHADMLEEEESS